MTKTAVTKATKISPATRQTQDEVKRVLLLDVVIRERTSRLQLLASKDQPLLFWWDPFPGLDFHFHTVDSFAGLHVESDRLAGQT